MITKPTIFMALFTATLLLGARPAWTHHSFAAEFDINKPVTLEGVLTKMEWTNPHGWIYVDVKKADGTVEQWAIEAGGPNQLVRQGLRKTDFPAGSQLIVTGYRARSGTLTAAGDTIKFKDGRNFFLGAGGAAGADK